MNSSPLRESNSSCCRCVLLCPYSSPDLMNSYLVVLLKPWLSDLRFTTCNSRSKTRSTLITWPGSAVNLISGRHRHRERERANLLEWTLSSNPLRPRRNIQHAYLVYHDFGKFLLKSWLSNPLGRGECICPPSPTPPSLRNHPLPHLYPNSSPDTSTRSHAPTLSAQSSPIICVRSRSLADPPLLWLI